MGAEQDNTCADIQAMLEAYALGALEPDERAAVERHLAGCATCRALADEWTALAAGLPAALSAASPHRLPPALKARVLAAVVAADARSRPGAAPAVEPATAAPRPAALRVLAWLRPRALAAAAAVLVLALSVAGVVVAREQALRAEYADLVAQQEVVLEVVDSAQTVKAILRPPAPGPTAYGKLYTRPDLPHVVVMAARLAPPPPGQAYHVWVTQQGRTRLAGLLAVNAQGFGLLVFDADRPGPVYDAAQLTLQPEGAAAPLGPLILRWEAR